MGKHTPAPWIHRDRLTDKNGATNIGTADGYAICDMAYHYSSLGRDEMDANASLIAAAPELFEALKAVEPYLDAIICYASTQGEYEPNRVAANVRAAIAKAEGA